MTREALCFQPQCVNVRLTANESYEASLKTLSRATRQTHTLITATITALIKEDGSQKMS